MAKIIPFPKRQQGKADPIENPVYWIPTETDGLVTVGKRYKLYLNEFGEDEHIFDDYGNYSLCQLALQGDFI